MRSFGPSTALVAASAFAPLASAGVAAVINSCSQPFYLWSVGDMQSNTVILQNSRYVYNETYYTKKDHSGISIKISGTEVMETGKTAQLEYTLGQDGRLWYDASMVDDKNKLWDVPYSVATSDPDCPAVNCKANEVCKDVYNNWDDNAATHECSATADLIMTLCPDGDDPATGSAGSTASTGSKTVVNSALSEDSDSSPKAIQFASGKTTHADIYVSPEGKLVGDVAKIADPSPSASPSPSPIASTGGATGGEDEDDKSKIFVHATWPGGASKRSVETHLHQHAQHSRLRRSRVFRQ